MAAGVIAVGQTYWLRPQSGHQLELVEVRAISRTSVELVTLRTPRKGYRHAKWRINRDKFAMIAKQA